MLEYSWKQEFVSHKVRLAKIPVAHLIDIVACLSVNTLRKVIGILIDAFVHVCHSGGRKKKSTQSRRDHYKYPIFHIEPV